MKRPSEKIVAGGFGWALLLLCGVAGAFYQSINKLNERRQWVEHTHQVLKALDEIHDAALQAEIAERLEAQRKLEILMTEHKRSNHELEQFADIAAGEEFVAKFSP